MAGRRPLLHYEGEMDRKPREADWEAFCERVPEWRERYLAGKNEALARLLTSTAGTPTKRFWEVHAAMEREARVLRDCLDGRSRSQMRLQLHLMHRYGLIRDDDLVAFSPEFREEVLASLRGAES
jgi:hypothetical protein